MKATVITLKLETPLLLTGLGNGEENSSQSLPFIPGSAMRGALLALYKTKKNQPAEGPEARTLFFSDEVRFLNAYPQDVLGQRALPVPASWRVPKKAKLETATVTDFALLRDPKTGGEQDERVSKPFCGNHKSGPYAFAPEKELAIHIGSEERGVVAKQKSTVFQYQALRSGQHFTAAIVADDEKRLDEMQALLAGETHLFLGRSRSAGYGRVAVESVQCVEWPEYPSTEGSLHVTVITLLSDVILRDENGQPSYDLDAYLNRKLGTPVKNIAAFIQCAQTGGFNRKWRLPLPQMPALGMGSAFVYPAGQLQPEKLQTLLHKGLGERLVEGYGRIAINWQCAETFTFSPLPEPEPAQANFVLGPASRAQASKMAERLLRQKLEHNLLAEAGRYSVRGHITNHQLARLRAILRQSLDAANKPLAGVTAFFDQLKKPAAEQWRKARLCTDPKASGARLELWVKERVEEKDGLAQIKADAFPTVAGQSIPVSDALKQEYTLRLLEAVIDRCMKQNRAEEG